ncbi:hypothetical protein [Psychroserpens burtonensis]|uniref:hypothetical protein n=1 Tax=Psychroserpens burtonensis TaxID=49278 RepID=UPI00040A000D|nr:hypothetical protein [Psychroserpens burtonensis]
MKNIKSIFVLTLVSLFFISCSNDDDVNPVPVNEEEVITTLIATLNATNGTPITMEFRDLDGDGPDAPVITVSSALLANTTYNGSLNLLNETTDPAESIREEIEEEANDHQFFFSNSSDLVTFAYGDEDGNDNPIGLLFSLTTTTVGNDTMTITLRHEPNKEAEGVSGGDITNAGGETDIAVTFPFTIE